MKLAREWLERIESYHRRVEGDDDCGNCGQAFPCDVVKLSRALDWVAQSKHVPPTVRSECERTLREVAGGSDD